MAIAWATKRRFLYFLIAFFVVVVPIFLIFFLNTYRAPTCFDHKQNGGETGVDCGGPCALSCAEGTSDLVVKWERVFAVSPGIYNAVAYVENKNDSAGLQKISYNFKIYDKDNYLIEERSGSTFINPGEQFAIFEPRIDTKYRIPARTYLTFETDPAWVRTNATAPKIDVINRSLSNIDENPVLTVTLQNEELFPVKNIQVVAILYDLAGNAIASSATYIDTFANSSQKQISFTWPQPFSADVSKIEVIPRVDVFTDNALGS